MNVVSLNDKIHKRSGHIAVPYKNTMIVWGGYMERVLESDLEITYSVYHHTDELWIYNGINDSWFRILTHGDIPPMVSGCCGLICKDRLYTFGGHLNMQENNDFGGAVNNLFCLDLLTRKWTHLTPSGKEPLACDKLVGWVYKEKLYFFGGFGLAPRRYYPFDHVPESEDTRWSIGWNNQFVCYNIKENCWEWPQTKGTLPLPRAAHSADITGHLVYVFGGRLRHIRNNELYCLNMETMKWSDNLIDQTLRTGFEVPEGRTWHSFTFISPNQAVLYGGLSQHNAVLSDCWILNVKHGGRSVQWETLGTDWNHPLLWHKSVCIPATGDVLIHGGLKRSLLALSTTNNHAEDLLILYFKPPSLLRLALNSVCSNFKQLENHITSLPKVLQTIVRRRIVMKTTQ
uniref:Kelch domain-containing protein n=1 Tax=Clastoptera arizonana TaxID=38151 RepID=A0A1B6DM86_9HEMI